MSSSRLEAFTDAIVAIVMTVLVLNLVPPSGDTFAAFLGLEHKLIIYIFSFLTLAIYWVNIHHLFQLATVVNGKVLWANIFFVFCLTLFPFATEWVGDHMYSLAPQLLYGTLCLLTNISCLFMLLALKHVADQSPKFKSHYQKHKKNYFSITLNIFALLFGVMVHPLLVLALNIPAIICWVVPSKKIEQLIN